MKDLRTSAVLAVLTVVGASFSLSGCAHTCPAHTSGAAGGERPMLTAEIDAPESLTVTLDGLTGELDQRHVFNGFGCTGENHSPAISWSGAPEGTQSFVIEAHDPDAPTGVGFFHWTVLDVPAAVTSLPFDAANAGLPEGAVSARTDFGTSTFGGPCPPPGPAHRYVFTVYAVDVPSLGVDASTPPAVVRFMLRAHTLALGRAIATYARAAN